MVAVLQGCGYPEYNLSHEVSRCIWERGDPLGGVGTGWMGRYLAAAGYLGGDIPAVNIGGSVAGEFQQTATSVLVFDRLQDFGFPYDDAIDEHRRRRRQGHRVHGALQRRVRQRQRRACSIIGGTGKATLTGDRLVSAAARRSIATDRLDCSIRTTTTSRRASTPARRATCARSPR